MLRFSVTLETITPIHIGCGEEYYPVDYAIDEEENKLYVVDEKKLLDSVEREGKTDEFTRLASNFTTRNDALLSFIRKRAKYSSAYQVDVEDNALTYIKANEGAFRAPISRFIRNRYDNSVYIPGSTIKGSLRTVVINRILRKIESLFKEEGLIGEKALNRFKIKCREIELLLNKEIKDVDDSYRKRIRAESDIMKFVKVSDFNLIGASHEVVYKVFAVSRVKGVETDGGIKYIREIKEIPDILECVDSGTMFEGEIIIKDEFVNALNDILKKLVGEGFLKNSDLSEITLESKEDLAKLMRLHYTNRVYLKEDKYFEFERDDVEPDNNRYRGYLERMKKFKLTKVSEKEFYMKLGKHGGAISKTIDGCRKIEVRLGNSGDKIRLDHQTTLWLAGGLPMGWVKGKIEDAN